MIIIVKSQAGYDTSLWVRRVLPHLGTVLAVKVRPEERAESHLIEVLVDVFR